MDLSLMNRSNSASVASSDHQLQSYEAQDLRGPSSTNRMLSSELQHNFIPVAGYHQQQLKQQQQQQQHGPISPGGHFQQQQQQQQQMFPFTASQWSELEHQALIFKYMVARAPVPPELVIPIRRSLILSSTNSAWGGFQMGAGSHPMDAEPGRCRRTDGKKWRCSKPVVADQKYCDRHMHRGRNRSRKAAQAAAAKSIPHSSSASAFQQQQHPPIPNFEAPAENRSRPESEVYQQSVKSSSLPQSEDVQRKTPEALRHFFDDWPRESKEHSHTSTTTSSEFDNARRNGLVFPPLKLALDDHETDDPYTNISLASVSGNSFVRSRHPWFTDTTPNSLGGPLAEALQNPGSSNNVVNKNQIRPVGFNLLDAQLSGRKQNHHLHHHPQQQQQQTNIVASPTGVLQKIACFSDCSSSASSPGSIRTDNIPHSLAQVE